MWKNLQIIRKRRIWRKGRKQEVTEVYIKEEVKSRSQYQRESTGYTLTSADSKIRKVQMFTFDFFFLMLFLFYFCDCYFFLQEYTVKEEGQEKLVWLNVCQDGRHWTKSALLAHTDLRLVGVFVLRWHPVWMGLAGLRAQEWWLLQLPVCEHHSQWDHYQRYNTHILLLLLCTVDTWVCSMNYHGIYDVFVCVS